MSAICVIEDDSLTRVAIEMILSDEGFDVRSFASAREFLNTAAFDDLGCILTDIEMPGGVTGLDLLAEVGLNTPPCPVVVMTGKGEGAFRSAAMALGARAYVEKPFSRRALVEAVASARRPDAGIIAAE